MKRILVSLLLIIFLSSFYLYAQEIKFSGIFTAQTANYLNYTDNAGDFITGGWISDGKLKYITDNSILYINAEGNYNAVNESNGNEAFSGIVKEAYFDYNGDFYSFRIGRQITAWGAADGLIVTDVLCPQDNNAFLAEDISDSRLGIDAIRLSLFHNSFIADFYVIPFFTAATLPLEDTDILHYYFFPAGVNISDIEKVEASLSNMEYAFRLSSYSSLFDFSLYAFYGYSDTPIFTISSIDSNGIYLSGLYKKSFMTGFASSIPVGNFTLRVEAALFPEKYFSLSTYTDTEKHDEYKALLGIDWLHGDFTTTAQYYISYIDGDISLIDEERYCQKATISISYDIQAANIELSASSVVNLEDFDSASEIGISYDLSDFITFKTSGKFFNSGIKEKGFYGEYKDLSCVILKGIYRF